MEFQHDEYVREEAAVPTPWGFWPTIGFSVIIVIAYLVATAILITVAVAVAKTNTPGMNVRYYLHHLVSSGMFLSVVTLATTPLMIGMVLLFVKLKKGISVPEYLALRSIKIKALLMWMLGIVLVMAVLNFIPDTAREWEINAYRTAGYIPLLWLALMVAAPLSEEIVCRGFLFRGIQASKMGAIGAIILSSLAWAALHVQYDLTGMTVVFIFGLYLGFARYKTNSIYTPLAIHSFINLVGTCQVAFSQTTS